jgi:hypothetical protein
MKNMYQIQQKSLNGYSWFVAGLAETLTEGLDCAEAMYKAYKKDAPWLELRVVEPGMPSYITLGNSVYNDHLKIRELQAKHC